MLQVFVKEKLSDGNVVRQIQGLSCNGGSLAGTSRHDGWETMAKRQVHLQPACVA